MEAKVIKVGNYHKSGHNASSIVDINGIAPTVMENHGTVTAILEPINIGDSNMSNQEFCPILMEEEYWINSQLSIARHYGGIRSNNHEWKIVNKQGITLWELSDPSSKHYVKDGMAIKPGEPADLCRTDFIPFYEKLGRDAFIQVLKEHQQTPDVELKKIYKEMTKKKKP